MRNVTKALCALALLAGAALAGDEVTAAQKGNKKVANVVKKAQDNVLVAELQVAYKVLDKANPVYKGHRAKALHDIKAAIGALEKEMHARGLKPHHHKHGKDEIKEVSHAQVVESAREVGQVLKQLNGLPTTKHRKKAAGHLVKAVKQLDLALKVERE